MKQNKILVANLSNVEKIAKLEEVSFQTPYTVGQITEMIEDSTYIVNVFEDILGYISAKIILDEIEICNLAVFSQNQGQGIGKNLVLDLIDTAKKRNCTKIHLEVRKSNEKAILLYEKCGFMKIGIRKNYYKTEDAILMIWEV